MNEGIHLDLDTWIVPGQIRKANLCRGLAFLRMHIYMPALHMRCTCTEQFGSLVSIPGYPMHVCTPNDSRPTHHTSPGRLAWQNPAGQDPEHNPHEAHAHRVDRDASIDAIQTSVGEGCVPVHGSMGTLIFKLYFCL